MGMRSAELAARTPLLAEVHAAVSMRQNTTLEFYKI